MRLKSQSKGTYWSVGYLLILQLRKNFEVHLYALTQRN